METRRLRRLLAAAALATTAVTAGTAASVLPASAPSEGALRAGAPGLAPPLPWTAPMPAAAGSPLAPEQGGPTAVRSEPGQEALDGLDPAKLQATLDATHEAGMPGLSSAARDGETSWQGSSGVADTAAGRPVRPDMRQRVGGITKTFVATAVLQQVDQGRVHLDDPVGGYLPDLVPGQRGRQVTVRMLLNHTSGIGDYMPAAFPSLDDPSAASIDANRYRHLTPQQLVAWGLGAKPAGDPGQTWSYSNTDYVILGLLLEKVTGQRASDYITDNVIRRSGLRHTFFPNDAAIRAPHPKMYESLHGVLTTPRDYSEYDMSWAFASASLVSTPDDLNHFYRDLLTGKLTSKNALAEMQKTVPVKDAGGRTVLDYGLGVYALNLPCGRFWGHDGTVWGAVTQSLTSQDGTRQLTVAGNRSRYQRLDGEGVPLADPIDNALGSHVIQALCGPSDPSDATASATTTRFLPLTFLTPNP
ncbi:serine hydrolase domain-containing protein [Actinomadura rupiterrae]|uniref:serine hydrolase domain-containing protein n=1 Tax=Actinomadura rupiterrae TaxID=559627 RepID=UPI0020A25860|nr:serine hydrolase [Actinomadura rupiterrae]MCP2337006.1 D-alanyl-D-alanine carboxypeptidase [Actinomadura rupiterrae]